MLNNIPASYFISVATSFILVAAAYFWKPNYNPNSNKTHEVVSDEANEVTTETTNVEEKESEKESDVDIVAMNSFDISATDEVEFVPLVSEEEDRFCNVTNIFQAVCIFGCHPYKIPISHF